MIFNCQINSTDSKDFHIDNQGVVYSVGDPMIRKCLGVKTYNSELYPCICVITA